MTLIDFFEQVPRLRVHDPLAELLGSAEAGLLEYGYGDAVRLTGHSCPTVAAAYWLTWRALALLYPDSLPERGGLRVEFQEGARSGSTGVVAAVVQLLTGAAGSSGFKGLGGRYNRAGLIRHAPDLLLSVRFVRVDTGEAVDAAADLSQVPPDPALEPLLSRCVHGEGSADDLQRLGRMWQGRVRQMLLERAHDPAVFILRPVDRRRAAAGPRAAPERRVKLMLQAEGPWG